MASSHLQIQTADGNVQLLMLAGNLSTEVHCSCGLPMVVTWVVPPDDTPSPSRCPEEECALLYVHDGPHVRVWEDIDYDSWGDDA